MMKPPKVLVVDDDEIVGLSFNRILSDKGYQVSTAKNGSKAIEKFCSENYDLVFTDIKMPGMSGLELARRLKEMNPWIPVVIVTGYGSDKDITEAEKMDVSSFLYKPVTPDVLEGAAKKALLKN